jgi:hypothetical protein
VANHLQEDLAKFWLLQVSEKRKILKNIWRFQPFFPPQNMATFGGIFLQEFFVPV